MGRGACVLRASLLRSDGMEGTFRYRSQVITATQVEFIRQLIAAHPGATRRRLSLLLCEAWDWKQANGAPLGYTQPVGEHVKYLVYAAGRPLACLAWSSAPRHLGARDHFIGWSAEARRRNLRFLAYNPRYLIVPYVQVKHLASHILGEMARRISSDWERTYGHPIYFLETFVDPERHRGTCYRAANWVVMGRTTGRGKNCPNKRPNRSIKEVLGYPLTPRFRELLAKVE